MTEWPAQDYVTFAIKLPFKLELKSLKSVSFALSYGINCPGPRSHKVTYAACWDGR